MDEVKLNFVLIGKTGHGKSETGNSLLNKQHFKTSCSTLPETREVDFSVAHFGKYLLLVVDEPGYDISLNKVKDKITAVTHMDHALAMCAGDIDVFLFVLKFGNRFTAEDKSALDVLKRMFGPSFLNHVIVVITGGDLYHNHLQETGCDVSFHEWCQQQAGELRTLYEDCKRRFVLFNNKEKNEEKMSAQIQEIIKFAEGLRGRSNRYTSQHFQDAEQERKKLILELKTTELAEGIQQQTSLLTSETQTLNKEVKLNFLLMGKTGEGKSATGNSLLSKNYFKAKAETTSVTKTVSFSFAQFDNYILLVVDGPGLADTLIHKTENTENTQTSDMAALAKASMNKATEMMAATKNMNTAIDMCYGGVDVFLFATRFGTRFTKEDSDTLKALKGIFGASYMKNIIVVVTCGDLFLGAMQAEGRDISFHDWCKQQKGEFKQLYEDCKGRFVLFNNWERDEEKKREQIQEIIQIAHGLKKTNGRYTSQCFQDADREREKRIVKLKAPQLTLEIQEKVSLLTGDIEKLTKNYSVDKKDKIEARCDDLMHEIEVQDKGYGVLDKMRSMVEQVKEHIDDAVELQRLAEKLEQNSSIFTVNAVVNTLIGVGGAAAVVASAPITGPIIAGGALIAGVSAAATGIDYAIFKSADNKIKQKQNEIQNKRKN